MLWSTICMTGVSWFKIVFEISRFLTTSAKIVAAIVFSLELISEAIGAVLKAGLASTKDCCEAAAAYVLLFNRAARLSALYWSLAMLRAFVFVFDSI